MSYNRNYNYTDFSSIVGMTFKEVYQDERNENDAIVFVSEDGRKFVLYHSQDCCEHVYIESIVGELSDLVDSPITMADESSSDMEFEDEYSSGTWTFYKLATRKGFVDIRFNGQSNGYYSEGVSFVEEIE